MFSDLQTMLHMGGYADYVWSAYAITLLLLLGNAVFAWRSNKRMIQKIKRWHHWQEQDESTP